MASPCEVIIDHPDEMLAKQVITIAHAETRRIEEKFSRYRDDNIIFKINRGDGKATTVDEETGKLLDYAQECFALSDGLFDISSGVLREAWKFNETSSVPTKKDIRQLLNRIGWQKIQWKKPVLTMQQGMEIDFGGIGKEYAVDRSAVLIAMQTQFKHILINYGGDINAIGPRASGKPWEIGLQDPTRQAHSVTAKIELFRGAIATSGDLHKCLVKDGVRYGHILNPTTGYPSVNSPRQVTVLSSTCIEAGILSTLAILQGKDAELFLEDQEVEYRVIR